MRAGLIFVGEVLDVTEQDRKSERTGNTWTETTIHVLAGRTIERIRTAGDHFKGDLPSKGDQVALEVSIETFARQGTDQRTGKPLTGYALKAWAVAESKTPAGV